MSTSINVESHKTLPISTEPSGLATAVIAGTKLLRTVRLCSTLGIAGFVLSFALTRNFRLFHVVQGAVNRIVNSARAKRQEGV